MPLSILRVHVWMWFLDAVFTMHRPTNGKPAPLLFVFCPRYKIDTTIRKNIKAAITRLKTKTKTKGAGFPVCVHMRFKHEVKNSDRNLQNWTAYPSNATCSHGMYRNHFLVVSLDRWRIGQCNRSIVSLSSGPSTPMFTLIGNDDFGALISILYRPNTSPKNEKW